MKVTILAVMVFIFFGATIGLSQTAKPITQVTPTGQNQKVASFHISTEVLTPKALEVKDSKDTLPGDIRVTTDLNKLIQLQSNYQKQLESLQNQIKPQWDSIQKQMQQDIERVKITNGWGSDVTFDMARGQWIRTLPNKK